MSGFHPAPDVVSTLHATLLRPQLRPQIITRHFAQIVLRLVIGQVLGNVLMTSQLFLQCLLFMNSLVYPYQGLWTAVHSDEKIIKPFLFH